MRNLTRKLSECLLLWSCLLAITAPSRADEETDRAFAMASFSHGLELVDARRYEEAALAFELAHTRSPSFAVLRNVGKAWAAARRPSAAIDAYSRFLSEGGERVPPDVRTQVEAELRALERLTATLTVTTLPAGAQIKVDGQVAGKAPLAQLRLDAGRHVIDVDSAGFHGIAEEVTASAGEVLEREYQLEKLEAVPPPFACPTVTVPARPDLSTALASARRSDRRDRAAERRKWSYVAMGGGLLVGLAAGALLVKSHDEYADWQREQQALDRAWNATAANEEGPSARQAANDARADRVQVIDRLAVGAGVAGTGLLLSGFALFLSSRAEPPEPIGGAQTAAWSVRFRW